MKPPIVFLIAAKPGIMQNSLQAYLRTLTGIHTILLADDALGASRMVETHQPALMIVDADLAESEMLELIRQARIARPPIQIVALVESMQQRQMSLAAGADYVPLKGLLDEQLRQIILECLEKELG